MQGPGEDDTGGRTGIDDGGEDGRHRPQAADAQASSQSLVTEGDHNNSSCETGPQDAGSQAAPGSSRPGSPVVSGVSAEEAAFVPQDEQASLLPGPSGDAAATASRLLELYPFLEDPWQGLRKDRKDKTRNRGGGLFSR